MDLDQSQKNAVRNWVSESKGISEIQKLLSAEFGVEMTYMDIRFLIDDIDAEIPDTPDVPEVNADISQQPDSTPAQMPMSDTVAEEQPQAYPQQGEACQPEQPLEDNTPIQEEQGLPAGNVSVEVSPVQRPGTIMSGQVVFSDGGKAEWVLDNAGRIGLIPATEGYNPPQQDIPEFQYRLQQLLGM